MKYDYPSKFYQILNRLSKLKIIDNDKQAEELVSYKNFLIEEMKNSDAAKKRRIERMLKDIDARIADYAERRYG